jgi:hypothetical protein
MRDAPGAHTSQLLDLDARSSRSVQRGSGLTLLLVRVKPFSPLSSLRGFGSIVNYYGNAFRHAYAIAKAKFRY